MLVGIVIIIVSYILFKLCILATLAAFAYAVYFAYQLLWLVGFLLFVATQGASLLGGVDTFFLVVVATLVAYLALGFALFFYWGALGIRGLFYAVELNIAAALASSIFATYANIKYHISVAFCIGELFLKDDMSISCTVNLDMLSLIGTCIVLTLTAIAMTFGIEYMSREAFGYNVLSTLCMFSASIVWFMLSYDLGLMIIFWEFSGLFSLLLVDTYYTRVRTTQAVSRTYAIGRFSDYWLFLAIVEIHALFETSSLSTIFEALAPYALEIVTVAATVYNSTALNYVAACIFVAASCKCAQFILFVWLPDAMEAPTPASALIHSSTLVVMGIFMIMRAAPIFRHAGDVLIAVTLAGAATILYGAVSAIKTSDLKKAVAYSTISQVGYLYCGCGLLAFRETLVYLAVHAICKALLFVFVGYVVHAFGGTTSLRKMGGLYYLAPDLALYVFILCAVLAGAPYTVGFIAKELIVAHMLSVYTPIICFVAFCWAVSFLCTPIYLYRVCVLPFFGRPRASYDVFKNMLLLKSKQRHFAIKSFDLSKLNSPLSFFMYHVRDLYISSRATAMLHAAFIAYILYCGEFFILLVCGFFNTGDLLFNGVPFDMSSLSVTSLGLGAYALVRNVQALILSLLFTVSVYVALVTLRKTRSSWAMATAVVTALACLVLFMLIWHLGILLCAC